VRRRRYPATVTRSGEPRLRRLADVVALPRRSPLYPELARALAAADAFHHLHSDLDPVPVRPTSTTSQSGCYRLRNENPVDLRVSRRHGRVPLSFLHELGHLVDHQLGWELGNTWASGRHEAFAGWREAAAAMPSRAPAGSSRARRRYFDSAKEVWARSYAQAALLRSDDLSLQRHLTGLLEADDVFVWQPVDFGPVALEIERLLDSLGLLRGGVAVAA
jgi:hypothetical protein